jgi:hypothetical protein
MNPTAPGSLASIDMTYGSKNPIDAPKYEPPTFEQVGAPIPASTELRETRVQINDVRRPSLMPCQTVSGTIRGAISNDFCKTLGCALVGAGAVLVSPPLLGVGAGVFLASVAGTALQSAQGMAFVERIGVVRSAHGMVFVDPVRSQGGETSLEQRRLTGIVTSCVFYGGLSALLTAAASHKF